MNQHERRKRLIYRANHRGIKEMDIILGRFADARVMAMGEAELDAFEALMEESDRDLLTWFTGEKPVPERFDTRLYRAIAEFASANAAGKR